MVNCDDCVEHSGIAARLKSQEELTAKIDDRLYHILAGLVLCLITSIITMTCVVYQTMDAKVNKAVGPRILAQYEYRVDY